MPALDRFLSAGKSMTDTLKHELFSGALPYKVRGMRRAAIDALKLRGVEGGYLNEVLTGTSPAGRMYRTAGGVGGAVGLGALGADAIDGKVDHPVLAAIAAAASAATPVGRRVFDRSRRHFRHNSAILDRLRRVGFETRMPVAPDESTSKILADLRDSKPTSLGDKFRVLQHMVKSFRSPQDNTLHVGVLRNSGVLPKRFTDQFAEQASWSSEKAKAMAGVAETGSAQRKVVPALRQARERMGFDTVNAGEVINANAYRTQAEAGVDSPLARLLGGLGYKRLYGRAPYSVTRKLDKQTADMLEGFVTTRPGWRSGNLGEIEYRHLHPGDRARLAEAGIRNADDFESALESIGMQSRMYHAELPKKLVSRSSKPAYDWDPEEFTNDAGKFVMKRRDWDEVPSLQEIGTSLRGAPQLRKGFVHPATKGSNRVYFDPHSPATDFNFDLSKFNR